MGLQVHQTDEGVRFGLRVAPRASRNALVGIYDGCLKVSLTAAPVDGAANQGLVKLLAKALGVAKSTITLTAGLQSRNKSVQVDGLTSHELLVRLPVQCRGD